jgi:hypothetical protein
VIYLYLEQARTWFARWRAGAPQPAPAPAEPPIRLPAPAAAQPAIRRVS